MVIPEAQCLQHLREKWTNAGPSPVFSRQSPSQLPEDPSSAWACFLHPPPPSSEQGRATQAGGLRLTTSMSPRALTIEARETFQGMGRWEPIPWPFLHATAGTI